ncbi:helix-turn-helix domain-containing protein [Epilithonimonas arachidiradicis]
MNFDFEIPYTRKQLAALIGLRVETIIRAIKSLESQNKLLIVGGKIYV